MARARETSSLGGEVEMWVKRREMIMLRVVNSLGPFFSSSNSMPRSIGKSVDWMLERWERAREVVQRAFRQSSVSWSSVSSCSSLHACQSGFQRKS